MLEFSATGTASSVSQVRLRACLSQQDSEASRAGGMPCEVDWESQDPGCGGGGRRGVREKREGQPGQRAQTPGAGYCVKGRILPDGLGTLSLDEVPGPS